MSFTAPCSHIKLSTCSLHLTQCAVKERSIGIVLGDHIALVSSRIVKPASNRTTSNLLAPKELFCPMRNEQPRRERMTHRGSGRRKVKEATRLCRKHRDAIKALVPEGGKNVRKP